MSKNMALFGGGIIIVLAVLLVLQNTGFIPVGGGQGTGGGVAFVSKDKAGEDAVTFIKDNLVNPGTELSLTQMEEESGVYKMNFDIMGQDEIVYITKDGKYLFTYPPIDMQPPAPKELSKKDVPEADLFVMSFCPFGNEAEELIMPIAKLLGDKADIELHYILYSGYATGYPEYCFDEEEQYCSMHGIQEVNQDIREMCVQKYQKDKLWDFVKAINEQATSENVDSEWEGIAQNAGINVSQIKTCQADEAEALLAQESNLTKMEYPVQSPSEHQGNETDKIAGSPTMVINGMIFDGERSISGYQEAICSACNNPPAECGQTLEENASGASGSCQ
jgi:hypothetical protein